MVKYKSRKIGDQPWTHGDLLALSHAKAPDAAHQVLFRYARQGFGKWDEREVTRKGQATVRYEGVDAAKLPGIVNAVHELELLTAEWKDTKRNVKAVVTSIEEYGLTREMVPTQSLNSVEVWEALLQKMPLHAMIRNLGKMTSIGLIEQLSDGLKVVSTKLGDGEYLRKSRVHPISVLLAMKAYGLGKGQHGGKRGVVLSWNPVTQVVDALDEAFYGTFENVEPVNKKIIYALDISGSMSTPISSSFPLKSAEVTAALSLILMRREEAYAIVGFDDGLRNLKLSPKMRLDDVMKEVSNKTYRGTDCSLPAQFAKQMGIKDVEAIVILTDGDTWAGNIHPFQALEDYRKYSGVPTKQVVLSTQSNDQSIADPRDPLSLDIVGFDTATPAVMNAFIRG